MTTLQPDIGAYLAANPNVLPDYIKANPDILASTIQTFITGMDAQSLVDNITNTYPVNFPDTPAFTVAGVDFTPFLLAGVVFPLLFIMLILVIMKNCYGYVFVFLWISVIAIWLGLNSILFGQLYPFQKQINMGSKYVLIFITVLFAVLTAIGIVLRVLSFPLQVLASPFSGSKDAPAPVYYYAPQAPAAPPVPPQPQAGGSRTKCNPLKGPPTLLYIPKSTSTTGGG
jgi:hypothetical protein